MPSPMDMALEEAERAGASGEVPVGAVLVEAATGAVLAATPFTSRPVIVGPCALAAWCQHTISARKNVRRFVAAAMLFLGARLH